MATKTGIPQAVKRHGGKAYLATQIVNLMPPHVHYVEPFFGGGAVLWAKNPDGVSEVVNDLDQTLTNFWWVLQSPNLFGELERLLDATPFSETEFELAIDLLNSIYRDQEWVAPDVARAAAFLVVNRQSRQALGKDFATLARTRTRRGMNEGPSAWLTAIEGLPEVHERLKRVVILCRPALKVIKSQDGPETLFYCDPPYLHETRATTSEYGAHEMTDAQHAELLKALAGIQGKFLLSGYHSEMYDAAAELYGWRLVEFDRPNAASGKKTKERKTECVWMNY